MLPFEMVIVNVPAPRLCYFSTKTDAFHIHVYSEVNRCIDAGGKPLGLKGNTLRNRISLYPEPGMALEVALRTGSCSISSKLYVSGHGLSLSGRVQGSRARLTKAVDHCSEFLFKAHVRCQDLSSSQFQLVD